MLILYFVTRFTLQGLRPKVPEHTPEKLSSLMEQCWQTESSVRPDFCDISITLQEIVAEVHTFKRRILCLTWLYDVSYH